MSSSSMCSSCLRALRQSSRAEASLLTTRRPLLPHQRRPTLTPTAPFSTTVPSRIEFKIDDITERKPTATSVNSSSARHPSSSGSQQHDNSAGDASAMQKFAQRMRAQKQMRAATEPYVAYGATEDLARECARAGAYTMEVLGEGEEVRRTEKGEDLGVGSGWWYDVLHLKPTFNTWAQITFLHMYLLTVRLRQFPAAHAPTWHQHLLDHFFYAAEDRMATYHAMGARSVRNRYLKDLYQQWRGAMLSYDEGLIKGDAVLAAAVWRNVYGAEQEGVEMVHVAEIVAWMRSSLRELERMRDEEVASGEVVFKVPSAFAGAVERESKMVRTPFSEADMKGVVDAGAAGAK